MNIKSFILPLILLAAIWLIMVLFVDPAGDFPLNDDWSYALSVEALVNRGEFEFTGWVSMPLVFQVVWGGAFSLLDGYSFTALRLSTITLGFWAVAATFVLLRSAGGTIATSVLGATVLLVNPIFFSLSNTFMTDVPFTAMFITSAALLLSGIRRDSVSLLAAGLIFACFALFIRQLGLALFAGFAIGYLSRHGFSPKRLALALTPAALGVALYIGYGVLLELLGKTPALYNTKSSGLLGALTSLSGLDYVSRNVLIVFFYIGLFLCPFIVLRVRTDGSQKWITASAIAGGLLIAAFALSRGFLFPMIGNVLFRVGCGSPQFSVGPVTLRDTFILCMNSAPVLPNGLRVGFLIVGAVSGTLVALSVLSFRWSAIQISARNFFAYNWQRFMLLSMTAAYITPLLLTTLFDRYIIPILPLLIAASLNENRETAVSRKRIIPIVLLVAGTGVFSMIVTHDYLSWNRARWSGLNFLEEERDVSSTEIDGGFEYNGVKNYSASYIREKDESWWWVHDDLYVVSFNMIEGYYLFKSIPIDNWMPGSKDEILVLRRIKK